MRQNRACSATLETRVEFLEKQLANLLRVNGPTQTPVTKKWYTTAELASAMGVTVYTVTARWCAEDRIEAVKDRQTGKWKIPRREYARLVQGGGLRPKAG